MSAKLEMTPNVEKTGDDTLLSATDKYHNNVHKLRIGDHLTNATADHYNGHPKALPLFPNIKMESY